VLELLHWTGMVAEVSEIDQSLQIGLEGLILEAFELQQTRLRAQRAQALLQEF